MTAPLDPDAYRRAVGRFASSVALVAAHTAEGFRGVTVSSFAVASWDPPLVVVCIDTFNRAHDALVGAEAFAVSVLSDRQEFLAERFAGRGPGATGRFDDVPHALAPSGAPVLQGAVAWLDCRRTAVHAAGDHSMLVGQVTAAEEGGGAPLVYHAGRYARLSG
jgi:flavin reductase (DIM6/NTAB) family NADH-FMN oxidoreductase RutF